MAQDINEVAPPRGWAVLEHYFNDDELPEPFKSLGFDTNNVGASVWVYLTTGAMVAAIPTGGWRQRARFAFYYAAPNSTVAFPLEQWTEAQKYWDGSDSDQYRPLHDAAIEYFNRVAGSGSLIPQGPLQGFDFGTVRR
ncbi:hypothetical protein [Mycobacteroides abscessus]|uniref:hypothetical protein n=1 Tax=Mycobacteroides abscessus TaxID=36809 RepID=UPI002102C838|nr:hypothetical protein [Mycobacteroides abscessus]